MNTAEHYSPWDLLPSSEPRTINPPEDYFYDNVAKHLVKDTVRIMNNGLPIDLDRVEQLEAELKVVLSKVQITLDNNQYIKQYLQQRYAREVAEYIEERKSKLKQDSDFIVPFKYNNQEHRSYFMHAYATDQGLAEPTELLPTGIPKWSANHVKKFAATRPLLQKLLNGTISPSNSYVQQGMQLRASHKCALYNRKFLDNIANPKVELPSFNCSSPKQKKELFAMLDIESEKTSKTTGDDSWDRKEIERINKETTDPIIKDFTQAMIDYSFGNIIQTNFVPAFYRYTVDGKLHGTLKLFGAKTFRYTSQNPNLLNAPSTGSIYAKPVKRCFIAPDDYLVYTIDLSALEDRVMASLSRDKNKCAIFTDGLDGHSLNTLGYGFPEIKEHSKLFRELDDPSKGKFFKETLSDGSVRYFREFD